MRVFYRSARKLIAVLITAGMAAATLQAHAQTSDTLIVHALEAYAFHTTTR